jgi:hypothetical protein
MNARLLVRSSGLPRKQVPTNNNNSLKLDKWKVELGGERGTPGPDLIRSGIAYVPFLFHPFSLDSHHLSILSFFES